jgi:ADP-ribose pyrophosphatase YjhB (NUDIX family)
MEKKRTHCSYCGNKISQREEGDILRDYCVSCETYFYENPLPVVSTIVVVDRELLLVKRKHEPHKGEWCLPSGFAEVGESIQSAALRELEEETGVKGKIIDFVCVDSAYSNMYGDLIFVTFEAEWIKGDLNAGDDAEEVRFFPFQKIPPLAFSSNTHAVQRYVENKQEYWAIADSFSLSVDVKNSKTKGQDFLSDKLIKLIESNAEIIAKRWLNDIQSNKSTPTYATANPDFILQRNLKVISQFGKWLGGYYNDNDIRNYYRKLGSERKKEGFALSEILSAISLTRKYIWEFALSQKMWNKTIDIYMSLELERRMMLFFDRAAYYTSRGYESG